ncbi:MAG: NADH-quinone oxidoreductase subunit J family protein [Anaerolineae bacterium]
MITTPFETALFVVFGAVAIAGALSVILARYAVYSALGMLMNFVALAAMYIMLSAEFLGIAQLIVYAGAIVVLFLFALMLIGGRRPAEQGRLSGGLAVAGGALAVVFLAQSAELVTRLTDIAGARGTVTPEVIARLGHIQLLGATLLLDYVLPFELASVLLLVGIVGAVMLARARRQPREQ